MMRIPYLLTERGGLFHDALHRVYRYSWERRKKEREAIMRLSEVVDVDDDHEKLQVKQKEEAKDGKKVGNQSRKSISLIQE
jgi:hypothetical protein